MGIFVMKNEGCCSIWIQCSFVVVLQLKIGSKSYEKAKNEGDVKTRTLCECKIINSCFVIIPLPFIFCHSIQKKKYEIENLASPKFFVTQVKHKISCVNKVRRVYISIRCYIYYHLSLSMFCKLPTIYSLKWLNLGIVTYTKGGFY